MTITITVPDHVQRQRRIAQAAASHRLARLPAAAAVYALDDFHIANITNIPVREDIDVVKAAFPKAGPLLERWLASWEKFMRSEPRRSRMQEDELREELDGYADRWKRRNEIAREKRSHLRWLDAVSGLTDDAAALMDADYFVRHGFGKFRNPLHHYVDDAAKFLALGEALPGEGGFYTYGNLYVVEGTDEEGLVKFSSRGGPGSPMSRFPWNHSSAAIDQYVRFLTDDDEKYWHSPAMARALGRTHVETATVDEAVDVLFAMAEAGSGKAFVKACSSKGGTWTVDLSCISDRAAMAERYHRDLFHPHGCPPETVVIQEHTPFVREQRCFVRDGRLIATVCSDRNFNPADARPGRRLDDRVAVIDVPEVDRGSFDRGHTSHVTDRALAAAFARRARSIVRELRAEGRTTYVIDMGATADGVIRAVEMNCFFRSGPYCLDPGWIVRAHARRLAAGRRSRPEAVRETFLEAAE